MSPTAMVNSEGVRCVVRPYILPVTCEAVENVPEESMIKSKPVMAATVMGETDTSSDGGGGAQLKCHLARYDEVAGSFEVDHRNRFSRWH
jgi:hypothetical protein